MLGEIRSSTDRAVAIVCCAFLEDQMRAAATRSFPIKQQERAYAELTSVNKPIGSYRPLSSYLVAIEEFGPDTFRDIVMIGKIRNEFAHNPNFVNQVTAPEEPSFDHHDIRAWCFKLITYPGIKEPDIKKWTRETGRKVFQETSLHIAKRLAVPKVDRPNRGADWVLT